MVYAPGFDSRLQISYAGWERKAIDATLLRACKLFLPEGLPLLYGENQFTFDLNDKHFYNPRPQHVNMDRRQKVTSKCRSMPPADEIDEDAIRHWMNVQDPQDLPDWIFCYP